MAAFNPTDAKQPLQLNITGTNLSGNSTLWQLASAEADGQNPTISTCMQLGRSP